MIPYIIAGVIGYGIAKLLEKDDNKEYAEGGGVGSEMYMLLYDFVDEKMIEGDSVAESMINEKGYSLTYDELYDYVDEKMIEGDSDAENLLNRINSFKNGGEAGGWKAGTTTQFKTKKEALKSLELLKYHNESNTDFRNLGVKKIEGDKLNEGWVVNFEYKVKFADGGEAGSFRYDYYEVYDESTGKSLMIYAIDQEDAEIIAEELDFESFEDGDEYNPNDDDYAKGGGVFRDFYEGQSIIIAQETSSKLDKSVQKVFDKFSNKELVIDKIESNTPYNIAKVFDRNSGEKAPFDVILNPKYVEQYARGGQAGNSFDDEDIAVYMCETEFGDDWFDGENYKNENVEAFYLAVHQYIKHLQNKLNLSNDETPLYEGNLANEDKKFIKDSLKESRYVSKNNHFAKGGSIKNYTKRELELFNGIFETYTYQKVDEKKILRFRNKLVTMNIGKNNSALDFVINVIDSIVDGELVPAKVQAPYERSLFEIKAQEMTEELVKMNPSYGKGKYANYFAGKDVTLNFAISLLHSISDGKWAENKNKMAEGGSVIKGYSVFNYTDNIYATDEVFKTKKLANDFIKEFRNRFSKQGYYRDSNMNKIDVKDIDLLAIPSDFNPFKSN